MEAHSVNSAESLFSYAIPLFPLFPSGNTIDMISPGRCLLDPVTACLISALDGCECSVSYIRLLPLQSPPPLDRTPGSLQAVVNVRNSFLQETEPRLGKPYLVITSSSLLLTGVLQTQRKENLSSSS